MHVPPLRPVSGGRYSVSRSVSNPVLLAVFRPIMHHNVRYNCRVLFLNR